MTRFNTYRTSALLAAAALIAAPFVGGPSAAHAGTITWKGVTFDDNSNAAIVDTNGDLVITPGAGNKVYVHTNRIPDNGTGPSAINDNDTPYIQFTYTDTGNSGDDIYLYEEDEDNQHASVKIGSIGSNAKAAYAKYGTGSGNGTSLFEEGSRSATSHTALLGKAADGTIYTAFDGELRSSDVLKNNVTGGDYDFNDIYLKAGSVNGNGIHFTDFQYGDDFTLSQVPTPSAALAGMAMMGLMSFRRRRRRERQLA